ncbi:MAG: hypothetical protein ACRDRW_11400 [Pseudonocardiaceae bacterium]
MAVIRNAGGACCAPRGVMRALSRVVMLGGFVVAGWLLGSGVGLASEDLGQPGTGLVQLVSDPGASAARTDDGSGGQLGASPTVVSAVRSAVWVPPRSAPPLARPGVPRPGALTPIVNTVGVPKPLTRVLAPQGLVAHALVSLSRPAKHDDGIRPWAPAGESAAIPPAELATRAAAATAPVPTLGPSVRPATVGTTDDCGRTAAATPVAGRPALGAAPAAPVPVSPAGSTTWVGMAGGTASGTGTKSAPYIAVGDNGVSAEPAPAHRLSYLGASDLPRSPAAQPSTSPD